MNVTNLGTFSEPLLIFGGAYGNLHALQKLKKIAKEQGFPPDRIIFTGDTSAYCAHPEECVQLIKEWNIFSIAGNIEIQLANGQVDCGCNFNDGSVCDRLSRQWYSYVRERVSKNSIQWMQDLPLTLRFELNGFDINVVHGSFRETSRYIFKSTPWKEKQEEFYAADADIIIAGHCGLPFSDSSDSNLWYNPGVIGMPANDGTPRVWYGIAEPIEKGITFFHKNFSYDHRAADSAMESRNLPIEYRSALISGIWDNCEILPEQEAENQGSSLSFEPVAWTH